MAEIVNTFSSYAVGDVSTSFDATGAHILALGVIGSSTILSPPTYNGVEFTQHLYQQADISQQEIITEHMYLYTLPSPDSGSNTFAIDFAGSAREQYCYLYALYDFPTTGYYIDSAYDLNTGPSGGTTLNTDAPPDISLTNPDGSICFGFLMGHHYIYSGAGSFFPGTGLTEDEDSQGIVGNNNSGRWIAHAIFTDGAGVKRFTATNAYSGALWGQDTNNSMAILLKANGSGGNGNTFFNMF